MYFDYHTLQKPSSFWNNQISLGHDLKRCTKQGPELPGPVHTAKVRVRFKE